MRLRGGVIEPGTATLAGDGHDSEGQVVQATGVDERLNVEPVLGLDHLAALAVDPHGVEGAAQDDTHSPVRIENGGRHDGAYLRDGRREEVPQV
jgi:hypothetical protein